jgi:3-deoxy-D-manno-octulosonic-acid transferase
LKKYGYHPLTFIAPRHSFKETEELLRDKKTNFAKLSEFESVLKIQDVINTANNKKLEIVLVDRYGVIENILPVCDLSFVGGSLIPIGGHNVLEPISYGIPTASGENIWNVEEREELIGSGVLNIVRKPEEIAGLVIKSDELKKMVEKYSEEKREKVKKELLKILEEISTILEV